MIQGKKYLDGGAAGFEEESQTKGIIKMIIAFYDQLMQEDFPVFDKILRGKIMTNPEKLIFLVNLFENI